MKATGIVRRIDELGRVVIPKEIRRTLRIREGDPLEIFTDRDGEVILKKYSPVGELSGFAKEYAESLAAALGCAAWICDKDQVIAASGRGAGRSEGGGRMEWQDRRISPELEAVIKERRTRVYGAGGEKAIPLLAGESAAYAAALVAPILAEGEALGAVVLCRGEAGAALGETECKVAETAAGFIGRQMEP